MATTHISDAPPRTVPRATAPDEIDDIVDLARFSAELPPLREAMDTAEPFPHVVIDDFLRADIAERALADFPTPTAGEWIHYKHVTERKIGRSQVAQFPDVHRMIVDAMSTPEFVGYLSRLTGIPGLFADPELEGGGLHQTQAGGFLSVHTDFSAHARHPSWARRVNVLVFFNRDWEDEYGGQLELWDSNVERCVTTISPTFNRCVIFPTNERTYHGHPRALDVDPGFTRKSLALYYFDEVEDAANATNARATSYRARPQDSAIARIMIGADNILLARYAALKRRFGFSDRFVSRLLAKFFG